MRNTVLKLKVLPNLSLWGLLTLLLSAFHFTLNLIWINLNKLPFPWDQAGHTIIAYKFTDYFSGVRNFSFLNISDYYPPFTHLIVSIFMLIFGKDPNVGPMVVNGFFVLSIFFLYLYSKEIFKSGKIAFIASLFYSFLPFVDNVSRYFLLEIPLVATTLASLYFLEKSKDLSDKKYVYFFAFCASVALLVKWSAAVYLFLPVLTKVINIFKRPIHKTEQLKSLMVIVIVVFMMTFLWYSANLNVILSSIKITSTAEESDPQSIYTLDNFIHYFHHMANFQLTWPGMLVFLASIPTVFMSAKKKGLGLLATIFFIYVVFSLVGNKDLRYIMVLAPLSSIMVAYTLVKFFSFEKGLAVITYFILTLYYGVYYFSLGFGFPIDPIRDNLRSTVFIPAIGGIDVINLAADSSFLLAPKYSTTTWPNLTIAKEMSQHNPAKKIKVLIVCEKPFFNQVNMELARRQLNLDKVEFFAPYSAGHLEDIDVDSYLNGYDVVLVADKDLGPQGGIRHIVSMRDIKAFLEGGKSNIASKINSYGLPDGDSLSVYKIMQWPTQIIVDELSKDNPKFQSNILVISSKKQLTAEILEDERVKQNKEKIMFSSSLTQPLTSFNLILIPETELASYANLTSVATRVNTYYLPDGDKLGVYRVAK